MFRQDKTMDPNHADKFRNFVIGSLQYNLTEYREVYRSKKQIKEFPKGLRIHLLGDDERDEHDKLFEVYATKVIKKSTISL